MKTIKINFVDFWPGFVKEDNFITNILKERYDVQIADQPDFLFFSCFGYRSVAFNGVKIFVSGEDVSPDFNLCDYAFAFDDIQFDDRYLRFPIFAYRDGFEEAKVKHIFTEEEIQAKTGFCNFVYTNHKASPARKQFFDMLSQYKQVDSGGGYLNNVGGRVPDKLEFQRKYKFSIAFENDRSDGYTTEKITDAFAAKTIPIYWGNKNVTRDFNPKAFINCNDYDSFEEVIERVKEIDNDDALFRAMLAEPIFAEGNDPEKYSMDRLREFLFHIFDQPLEEAPRRSKYSWQKFYLEDLQNIVNLAYKVSENKFVLFAKSIVYKIKSILHK